MRTAAVRDWLEGRRGGRLGAFLRLPLIPLGAAYGSVLRLRELAYKRGVFPSYYAKVPVVSVGNLTAGGTGKTPACIALCRLALRVGYKAPAILTRGYGAAENAEPDEVRLFHQHVPDVPVWIGSDRAASAEQAVQGGADLLILDDGFQHLRLRRELDIVLLDATCPWGGGWPIPAGVLREFPGALRRAGMFVLTRCEQAPARAVADLTKLLQKKYPGIPIVSSEHAPSRLMLGEQSYPLQTLHGQRVVAVCGIGRPDAFCKTLSDGLGAEVAACRAFADHHAYTKADLVEVLEQARRCGAEAVTTEKDMVKLAAVSPETASAFWTVGVDLRFADEEAVVSRLRFAVGSDRIKPLALPTES